LVRDSDPSDVLSNDALSRRLKRRLRDAGVTCLFAFNTYTRRALARAAKQRLWLIASIARRYCSLFDGDGVIESALDRTRRSTVEIAPFSWRGATCPPNEVYSILLQHLRAASKVLAVQSHDAALWYQLEADRVELLGRLRAEGIYASRISLLDATHLVQRRKLSKAHALTRSHQNNFNHIMLGEHLWFDYAQGQFHVKAAEELAMANMPLLALHHSYAALRCELLLQLHRDRIPMLEGEVVQQWLLLHGSDVSASIRDELHEFGLQSEQVLGRSQLASFDLDEYGEGVYDLLRPAPLTFYGDLREHLQNCARAIAEGWPRRNREQRPQVSVIIPTYRRPTLMRRVLASVQGQVMPPGSVEVIVVHDGPTVEPFPASSGGLAMQVTYVTAPRGGAARARMCGVTKAQGEQIAFVDDDVVLSPTWLIRVLQTLERESAALVGSTILSFPPSSLVATYCDYRELLRRPVLDHMGRIVNIVTACAVIHRGVLDAIGEMAPLHQRYCVTGADDVDFTWAVNRSGARLVYANDAFAFHDHRSGLRELLLQHIGYGEGATLHCIGRDRPPDELSIPASTMHDVALDTLAYLVREVPKRVCLVWRAERSIKAAVLIPILDAVRRIAYNVGVYRGRRYAGVRT
jgi:glycosyltransferase involved in cell wall biosynthesis